MPGWQTLVERRPAAVGAPLRIRRLAVQLGVIALALAVLVALGGALLSRRIAESQSVHEVARTADLLADSVVQPELTDAMATDPLAAAALDSVVSQHVLSSDLIRVKLWTADGLILYSDESRLVGQQFALDDEARQSLSAPQTQAEVSELTRPENVYERGQGRLLEVYRPIWTPDGHELLFESYFRYGIVSDRTSQLWHGFLGITVSAVAMLFVLLIPLVAALWTRARRAARAQQASTRRALLASEQERRRIAAGLHDGPVQELAAASFALTGAAAEARNRGESDLARALADAAETVRSSQAGLRTVSVELYPPSLQDEGLAAALAGLAAGFGERRLPVRIDVPPAAVAELTEEQQQGVFRIVRELLQNAAKHAGPARAGVRLLTDGVLIVTDDGTGFHYTGPTENHLGLALVIDLCRQLGAGLELRSAPAAGTDWRITL